MATYSRRIRSSSKFEYERRRARANGVTTAASARLSREDIRFRTIPYSVSCAKNRLKDRSVHDREVHPLRRGSMFLISECVGDDNLEHIISGRQICAKLKRTTGH